MWIVQAISSCKFISQRSNTIWMVFYFSDLCECAYQTTADIPTLFCCTPTSCNHHFRSGKEEPTCCTGRDGVPLRWLRCPDWGPDQPGSVVNGI